MIAKITPLIRLPSTADVFDYFVPPDLEAVIRPGQLVSIPWRSTLERGVVLDILEESLSSQRACPEYSEGRGLGEERSGKFSTPNPHPSLSLEGRGKFRARPIRKIIDPEPILNLTQLKLVKKFSKYYFCAPGSVARLMVPEKVERVVKSSSPLQDFSPVDFKIEKSQLPFLNQAAAKINRQTRELEIKDVSSFIWFILFLTKQKQYSCLTILLPTIHWLEAIGLVLKKKLGESLAVIHSRLSRGVHWREYQKILQGKAKIVLSTRQGVFLPLPRGGCIIMFDAGSDDFKQYDQHPRYDSRTVAEWAAELTASQLIYAAPTFFPGLKPRVGYGLPPASRFKTRIRLIDMKQSLGQKGFSIISEAALEAIEEAERNKKRAVIISLREESEQGISVKSIQEILTKEGKNVKNESAIIIDTPQILELGTLAPWRGQISSLIIASIEPLLAMPDYRSSERAFYRLKRWQMLAQELSIPEIILQSYSPDNLAVRAFAISSPPARGGVGGEGAEEQFVKTELESRQQLGYPPFVDLVKLSYKGQDEKEFRTVMSELKADSRIKILGPYIEHRSQRKSLLLKFENNISIPLLRSLPSSTWVVDREPENVL